MKLSFEEKLERRLRKTLGLPKEPPNTNGFYETPTRNGNYKLEFLTSEELAKEKEIAHAEGWRRKLAHNLSRFPINAAHDLEHVSKKITMKEIRRKHRIKKELAKRHYFIVKSHYYHLVNDDHVEVYLDFDNDLKFYINIYAKDYATKVINSTFDYYDKKKELYPSPHIITRTDAPFVYDEEIIIVNNNEINNDIIRDALTAWHADYFAFDLDHWSNRKNSKKPIFIIDLLWQEEDEYYSLTTKDIS